MYVPSAVKAFQQDANVQSLCRMENSILAKKMESVKDVMWLMKRNFQY
jgi:hypothetical protein